MKWSDDLALDNQDLWPRAQIQLAMYAIHLSCGHNIYCRQLKANTIEQYVSAVALFLKKFSGVDFRKDAPSDSHFGQHLAPVFKELRRYETVPDRREPYTPLMHEEVRRDAAKSSVLHLVPALADFFEQGLLAGYRLSEWAQPGTRSDVGNPQRHTLPGVPVSTRALVPLDIRCTTTDYQRAKGLDILNFPVTSIASIWIKFRVQKNGHNGEERQFVRNPNDEGYCMVQSMYRVLSRYKHVMRLDNRVDPSVTPLGLYWNPYSLKAQLITSTEIESYMRLIAARVYRLDPVADEDDIRRWGSHSLRVGACVVLHAQGFQALDIQWLLRWRSLAFMMYLRNVGTLSQRQVEAVDREAAMPNFFQA